MSRHQRRFDDVEFDLGGRSRSGGVGTVVLATVLGVGIGMLAAPDTGLKTRRRLRRRLSELGEGLEGGIGEIQEHYFASTWHLPDQFHVFSITRGC